MGFCKPDQKSMPVVGLLTHNDCDVLRAKTGLYRRVTPRTLIPPTVDLVFYIELIPFSAWGMNSNHLNDVLNQAEEKIQCIFETEVMGNMYEPRLNGKADRTKY